VNEWRKSHTFFVHLGIILILALGFYSGLSGRVRAVYLFSLCIVSLLSSRFTASLLVWFSNFLEYLVFHFLFHWAPCSFVDLHGSCGCSCTKVRSEWIGEYWIESAGRFRILATWSNNYDGILVAESWNRRAANILQTLETDSDAESFPYNILHFWILFTVKKTTLTGRELLLEYQYARIGISMKNF
jgi:hypothetical protein